MHVLLFHHALGLTPGLQAFADDLRSAGHSVVTPDLFGGVTFDSIEAGVAHAATLGFGAIADEGPSTAADMSAPFVVAGFSLGVLPAQKVAITNDAVRGVILYHGAVPPDTLGGTWPEGLPLQMHFCREDPWAQEDFETATALAAASGADLLVYPGNGHLVADRSSPDYDPAIARQITEHSVAFLDGLDDASG